MQNKHDIQALADQIASATNDLSKAQQALRDDKKRRQSSLRGMFVDWLTSTPAEKEVQDKEEKLSTISAEASKIARKWIINEAVSGLQSSPEDTRRHAEQCQRLNNANKRQDLAIAPAFDIFSFFNMQSLDKAASQCREASKKLAPLLSRLQNLHDETAARVTTEQAALHAIEAPYLHAAAALVPPIIRVQVPTSLK